MYKDIIKPTLTLIIISVIVGGLLAVTYNLTGVGNIGTGISQVELDELRDEVAPNATTLSASKITVDNPALLGVYTDKDSKNVAIHVVVKGYGGDLKVLVGIDEGGAVSGAKVLETAETPGIGTKVEAPEFIGQYIGKSGSVALKKDGGEIDGIAGATVSSGAFTSAINSALEIYEQIKGEI